MRPTPPRIIIYHLTYFFRQHITQQTISGTFKLETFNIVLERARARCELVQRSGAACRSQVSFPCSLRSRSGFQIWQQVSVAIFLDPRI